MNALKILFLLSLSMLNFKMTAQIDDLLKNKDITWIAETYNDFAIHESFEADAGQNSSRSIPLKLINKSQGMLSETYAIQEWLIEAVKNEQLPIFDDENLKQKQSYKIITNADIITEIDPITFLTRVKVVVNNLYIPNILLFRAKQIIFYNSKKAQFGMRTLAVAPIYNYRDYDYNTNLVVNTPKPLFWFKPQDLNKTQRLSKKNITWAKRMSLVNGLAIHSDSVKILKKVAESMPLAHLFLAVKTNRRLPFYKNETGIEPRKKIPFEERKNMFSRNDTLRILDPLTYTESYKMITEETKPSDCESLQLIQNWYWNDRKKRLEIYLVATAPLKDSYFGGYKMPLFYCRTDD